MTRQMKRPVALLLSFVMAASLFFGVNIPAQAATVNYVKSGNYVYNWGERGVKATFLSPMAEDFYKENGFSYPEIAALAGSSSTSSVPSSELYKKLQSLMKNNHTHETSYGETRQQYQYTDCQNSGADSKAISSFYSGKEIGPAWDSGATWNREHTWPNSKGLGGNDENDIMMLRPTWVSENSSRGNTAYGESAGYFKPNVASAGAHDVRGDVARIVLYTYVRWGNTGNMWGSSGVIESKEVLIKWMKADPVDTWELGRNDAVEAITGTRNVFVDYPELAFELFEEEVPSNYASPSGAGAKYGTVPPATPDNGNQNTGNDSGNTTVPDNSGSNTNQNTGGNQNTGSNQGAGSNQNTGSNQGTGNNNEVPDVDEPVVDSPTTEIVDQDTETPSNSENKSDASEKEDSADADDKNESADEGKENDGGMDLTWVFAVMLIVGVVALVALIISDKKKKKSE